MNRVGLRYRLKCRLKTRLACLAFGATLLVTAGTSAAEKKAAASVKPSSTTTDITRVTGISVQGSDEYPKVLHIIPWRAPTLSRRARPKLKADMPDLLQAQQPAVLNAQRHFRQTRDILPSPDSGS